MIDRAQAHKLAQIHAEAFTTPKPWDAASIMASLESPFTFLIESENGFLIGSALAGEAELLTLAVAKQARRKGEGQFLVEAFLTESQARQAETAFLEVSAENPNAIALYLKLGFQSAGLRKGYYRSPEGHKVDALVMSLVL